MKTLIDYVINVTFTYLEYAGGKKRKSSSLVGGVAERGGCPGETAPGAASPLIDVEALSDASRSPPPEPPPAATPVPGQCAATAETV